MRIFPVFRGNYVYDSDASIPLFKLPCWPRPSTLTVLLTSSLYRVISYFFIASWFGLIVLFAFDKQVDKWLEIFGYEDNFVSSFPFIRYLYSRFGSFSWIKPVDIGYFHLLDATLWISLIVWGIWVAAGLVFLRQYADLFQKRSAAISSPALPLLSKMTQGRTPLRYLAVPLYYLAWIWFLSIPVSVTYIITKQKILSDPEIVLFINNLTGVFFYILALIYCYGVSFLAIVILFLGWKIFRQKRPGVILWREDSQRGARGP